MAYNTVFIISNEAAVRDALAELVIAAGLHAATFLSLKACLDVLRAEPHCCLVLDNGIDDKLEPDRQANFTSICSKIPVLVLTERGDIPAAVNAIRQGALDVIQKPLQHENILERIKSVVSARIKR
jgi:FixJ family two-component response regulator